MEQKNITCFREDYSTTFYIRLGVGTFNTSSTGFVLIIAIISWIFIPKWRSYSNFMFLNLFLTDLLQYWCFMDKQIYFITFHSLNNFLMFLRTYLNFVYFCWLFLFSINIYMDCGHFKINMTWKFVKSSAFAWGLPLILHILLKTLKVIKIKHKTKQACHRPHSLRSSLIIKLTLEIILLIVNFCAYLVVISVLLKQRHRDNSSLYRKIFIVSRTFVICIVLWLLSIVLEASISTFNSVNLSEVCSIFFIMHCTQSIYLKLYFVLSKSNRKEWRKYFRTLHRSQQSGETLPMSTVQ